MFQASLPSSRAGSSSGSMSATASAAAPRTAARVCSMRSASSRQESPSTPAPFTTALKSGSVAQAVKRSAQNVRMALNATPSPVAASRRNVVVAGARDAAHPLRQRGPPRRRRAQPLGVAAGVVRRPGRRAPPARRGPCWTAGRGPAGATVASALSRRPVDRRCVGPPPAAPRRHGRLARRPPWRPGERTVPPALPASRADGRRCPVPSLPRRLRWAWAGLRASGCAFGRRAQPPVASCSAAR